MKRNAKQNGSGGRLRLGLLMASVAAFLLIPAAAASAGVVTIVPEGSGSGVVENEGHGAVAQGEEVHCRWNGTEIVEFEPGVPSVCVGATFVEILEGYAAVRTADTGSEFGGAWVIEGGGGLEIGCGAGSASCTSSGSEFTMRVPFALEPKPAFPLNVTESGTAGSVTCLDDGSPCGAEVEEESSVELIAEPGAESDFAEWTTGPCVGETTETCSFTMPAAEVDANAEFVIGSEELTVNSVGEEGTVECNINGGGFAVCAPSYSLLYGETVEVTAEAAAEHKLVSLSGPSCSLASETEGSCSFTIEADSEVTAEFEPAGTKAEIEPPATVEGEVPITTSLEGCELPVVLGPFVPTVVENYDGECDLIATSTGNETVLIASDEDETATKGHLVQPPYKLPSALKTRATGLGFLEFPGTGGPFEPLSSDVTLLEYGGPVAADEVTVFFRQHIGLHDALHTGSYSKTITLTLEQTA